MLPVWAMPAGGRLARSGRQEGGADTLAGEAGGLEEAGGAGVGLAEDLEEDVPGGDMVGVQLGS
jgi:hypothetical protein